MTFRVSVVILFAVIECGSVGALEPDEILVIANKDIAESEQIARYYCKQRGVPEENILALSLGTSLKDTISRNLYEERLAEPIRKSFFVNDMFGQIKCLLTVYGVPIKVGRRALLEDKRDELRELKESADKTRQKIDQLKQENLTNSDEYRRKQSELAELRQRIDYIEGKETGASVDSELSMVLFGVYDLYRWQPNKLNRNARDFGSITLMVSRLDGPDSGIARDLVDKAIAAEKAGLKGSACIDSRGITSDNLYGRYDQSLRDLADVTRSKTDIPAQEERTQTLFAAGSCPQTALYCGWYSPHKYVDSFDFVDGAIGYHIASFEAVSIRDPNSTQWCPSMLREGITATLGPVAEPYLAAFPEPKEFFVELYKGTCLVEAYYRTKRFNSWQLVLIGDPLYRPFKGLPLN